MFAFLLNMFMPEVWRIMNGMVDFVILGVEG